MQATKNARIFSTPSTLYFDCGFSSFSSEDIKSFAECLNSRSVLPNARPISGSLDGPKMISAMINIKISPGTPMLVKPICRSPPYIGEIFFVLKLKTSYRND
jgi:hypothetical protein